MDANNELLQAIGQMMDSKLAAALEPIQADISAIKEDIETIKEDTAEIRTTVNAIGEWTEIAADVLKIKYPI